MGRSHRGLTTKIHVVVDAEGRPIRVELTAGQAHDSAIARDLLDGLGEGATLLADAPTTPTLCVTSLTNGRLGRLFGLKQTARKLRIQQLRLSSAQYRRALLQQD